ncbi:di-heme oxidoreductase family protein [Parachitinimonas caeni]|uniref:Di-heme oxidoredictase family protein n=1 Tax=Parachitinimonas caeni TaxID=3031301 RepID=A0ABT7E347_9NEIS|nr:di-heme oxidoredictase family protein [Parachitinimonas caeni]MDK2125337.1 di-heme oxidoredictase family protein [Parachitinimonas caeni]
MQKHYRWRQCLPLLAIASTCLVGATVESPVSVPEDKGAEYAGGDTTVFETGRNAFSLPAANLNEAQRTDFAIGNSFFKRNWVEAPSSTSARDGLGPHFIARSCGACHTEDGRGAPPDFKNGLQAEQPVALLFRLSIPGVGEHGSPKPEPRYGGQFNNDAISGVKPEGRVEIRYREVGGKFDDGEPYSLRQPEYRLTHLAYGKLHPQTMVSPRVAPQMIGLGLLDAIRPEDIEANAKRQAEAGGAIHGRPNWVWDAYAQKAVIGRFGWKANSGSIAHQSAAAFNGDIGITSSRFPAEECMPVQRDCQKAPRGGKPEIDDDKLDKLIFYSRTQAVPARRNLADPRVKAGEAVFHAAQCAVCHTPKYTTGVLEGLPQVSNQTIRPYTDLLLHDMGPGLGDGRPDFLAKGNEWKTPPLWGLGLVPVVNGHSHYLHDGRARNLMEAVLWHGGEAEPSKRQVLKLSKQDRANLIFFLESL